MIAKPCGESFIRHLKLAGVNTKARQSAAGSEAAKCALESLLRAKRLDCHISAATREPLYLSDNIDFSIVKRHVRSQATRQAKPIFVAFHPDD